LVNDQSLCTWQCPRLHDRLLKFSFGEAYFSMTKRPEREDFSPLRYMPFGFVKWKDPLSRLVYEVYGTEVTSTARDSSAVSGLSFPSLVAFFS
ncbi:unnamed protein product, partial [Allacma fusca]